MNPDYQQARLARDPRFDGSFFIAVKTTHIFCRSICPANVPLEKVIGKDKGWFRVSAVQNKHYLKVEIRLLNIEKLTTVLTNIERMFDLNADTNTIQTQLLRCGVPKDTMVTGLRIPGVWDTFEAGCRAILGQQISVKAAIRLLSQLTKELGSTEGDKVYFPTPNAIANSDLSFLKIPHSRRQTLRLLAQHNVNSSDSSVDDWLNIKGIGPWTVAYAKMRGQTSPDIWLNTDLIVKKQLEKFKIDPELARPWRSYLTFQLWSMA